MCVSMEKDNKHGASTRRTDEHKNQIQVHVLGALTPSLLLLLRMVMMTARWIRLVGVVEEVVAAAVAACPPLRSVPVLVVLVVAGSSRRVGSWPCLVLVLVRSSPHHHQ